MKAKYLFFLLLALIIIPVGLSLTYVTVTNNIGYNLTFTVNASIVASNSNGINNVLVYNASLGISPVGSILSLDLLSPSVASSVVPAGSIIPVDQLSPTTGLGLSSAPSIIVLDNLLWYGLVSIINNATGTGQTATIFQPTQTTTTTTTTTPYTTTTTTIIPRPNLTTITPPNVFIPPPKISPPGFNTPNAIFSMLLFLAIFILLSKNYNTFLAFAVASGIMMIVWILLFQQVYYALFFLVLFGVGIALYKRMGS